MSSYSLVYAGRGRDDFLEFYSEKLAQKSKQGKLGEQGKGEDEPAPVAP